MRKLSILALLLFICSFTFAQVTTENFDCSTVIVGKDASATGHVMIGHNEDDGGEQVVNFYKMTGSRNNAGKLVLKNGAVIDQPGELYGYIWMEMPGQDFADSFLNENGVLVTSNSCPSKERYGEIVDGGIGYNLRKIIAERAESARHGVELAGELISSIGYSASGRTYTIADPGEAWMLSVVRGKHWVAMRVPDNEVVYLPNYYIIKDIDFDDPGRFMYSGGLKEYAITRGWYDASDGEFNFREVYGNTRSAASMSNIGRMWVGVNELSGSDYDIEADFPVSFIPPEPVAMEDVIAVLDNHYEGTELDDSDHYRNHNPHKNKAMSICAGHQQMSFVAELRHDMPVETGCRLWIAPRRGCVNAYFPVYYGIKDFPERWRYFSDNSLVYDSHFNTPEGMYDRNNGKVWWEFVKVTEFIDDDYAGRIEERREFRDELQQYLFKKTAEFDAGLPAAGADAGKKDAGEVLSDFSRDILSDYLEKNRKYARSAGISF